MTTAMHRRCTVIVPPQSEMAPHQLVYIYLKVASIVLKDIFVDGMSVSSRSYSYTLKHIVQYQIVLFLTSSALGLPLLV